ncbi:MAG: PAS domain-containing sensor histidine kinase [Alphaproteobacteria bacterium]|nr:PAS domain-containing sensor histidine kinase [Alphaproteobacteria bacterium]
MKKKIKSLFLVFKEWAKKKNLEKKTAVFLAITVLISCVTTYAVISSNPPLGPDPKTVIILLNINLVLLLFFGIVVTRQIVSVWHKRKEGAAGSGLHVKLALAFSLAAIIPTIIVLSFSVVFFHLGIENWFNSRVSTAVNESKKVAEYYLKEHKKSIESEVRAMADDYNQIKHHFLEDPEILTQFIEKQAIYRELTEAILYDHHQRIIASYHSSWSLVDFPLLPDQALKEARKTGISIFTNETNETEDRMRALLRIVDTPFIERFLYIARNVNPLVHENVNLTLEAASAYEALHGQSGDVEILFVLVFIVVALLFLLASIWSGLRFATQLVTPITNLIGAAERVSAGDFSVRVTRDDKDDALGILSKTFNKMTDQLVEQRQELMIINQKLEQRQRFSEAVLQGVSAGVIGLDKEGRILLPNKRASDLLSVDLTIKINEKLEILVPELAGFLNQAIKSDDQTSKQHIKIMRKGRIRTLSVTLVAEGIENPGHDYVITFDDITELLSAQRQAAWADAARRVAHEIKNPLTPIQLAAERLQRKYMKEIVTDPDVFKLCTDTIIRQVDDIGKLVDEFSSFARMPAPSIKDIELKSLAQEILFLHKNANPDIHFALEVFQTNYTLKADPRQVRQVIQNLIKNAVQALKSVKDKFVGLSSSNNRAMVRLTLRESDNDTYLDVEDNGPGFPIQGREELIEPYVTFHPEGSGLGLAIIRKIMEDHNGELILGDSDLGGARVTIRFQKTPAIIEDNREEKVS